MEKEQNFIYRFGFLIGRIFIAYPIGIRDTLVSKKNIHKTIHKTK